MLDPAILVDEPDGQLELLEWSAETVRQPTVGPDLGQNETDRVLRSFRPGQECC
jgi:hypothetical protein